MSARSVQIKGGGSSGSTAEVDPATGALVVTSETTALIRESRLLETGHTDENVADAGVVDIYAVTPAEPILLHVEAIFAVVGDFLVELFEDTTVSANGTLLPVVNRDFRSSFTGDLDTFVGPTVTDVGNKKLQVFLIGGARNASVGVEGDSAGEIILKPSTAYMFRLTNKSGSTSTVDAILQYWQETTS